MSALHVSIAFRENFYVARVKRRLIINVLHTVHSIAIIQILLFVFCSQSMYYASLCNFYSGRLDARCDVHDTTALFLKTITLFGFFFLPLKLDILKNSRKVKTKRLVNSDEIAAG